jgi:hypothetical protein
MASILPYVPYIITGYYGLWICTNVIAPTCKYTVRGVKWVGHLYSGRKNVVQPPLSNWTLIDVKPSDKELSDVVDNFK